MHQLTLKSAQKAIAAFREEVGYRRVTGGLLPSRRGLVVAVKPGAEGSPPSGSNANGSPSGLGSAAGAPLQALLIVPDQGEDTAALLEELDQTGLTGTGGDSTARCAN